jgi:cytochrome c oxidase assembly protein subunit 15
VRRLAWTALAAVVAQGVLGGLTVIYLLPTSVSVTHACLAQAFFCLVVALAYVTSREWLEAARTPDAAGLRGAAVLAAAVVYLQLLLGALMRHTGAGLAIPDFPLAFGRLFPPLSEPGVLVHFAHRLGALAVLGVVVNLAVRGWKSGDRRFSRPSGLALALTFAQIALGATAVLTQKAVTPTTAHVATGAAVLGVCFFLALRTFRLTAPRAEVTAPAGDLRGRPAHA